MQRLISSLFLNWVNRPALVIGGGPSARNELPYIAEQMTPAVVISANQHGYLQKHFKVDLAVCCDKKHCKERVPMGPFLRQWTAPNGGAIVSRWSFADYRLGDWQFIGNTGLTAVAVAAALGCNPIVVTGLDFWATGRVYFHELNTPVKRGPRRPPAETLPTQQHKRLHALSTFTRGANIRALSGPIATVFGSYKNECLPAHRPIAYRRAHYGEVAKTLEAGPGFKFSTQDVVPTGTELALTPEELKVLQAAGHLI